MNKVKGLYGAEFDKSRAVGYCHYHNCYLTSRMVKTKQCLSKQCDRLQKYDSHEWWYQRSLQKQRKQAKKQINKLLI